MKQLLTHNLTLVNTYNIYKYFSLYKCILPPQLKHSMNSLPSLTLISKGTSTFGLQLVRVCFSSHEPTKPSPTQFIFIKEINVRLLDLICTNNQRTLAFPPPQVICRMWASVQHLAVPGEDTWQGPTQNRGTTVLTLCVTVNLTDKFTIQDVSPAICFSCCFGRCSPWTGRRRRRTAPGWSACWWQPRSPGGSSVSLGKTLSWKQQKQVNQSELLPLRKCLGHSTRTRGPQHGLDWTKTTANWTNQPPSVYRIWRVLTIGLLFFPRVI